MASVGEFVAEVQRGHDVAKAMQQFVAHLAVQNDYCANQEAETTLRLAVTLALGRDGSDSRTSNTSDGTIASTSTDSGGGIQAPLVTGAVCGHLFKKGEVVYRCRTCGMDDTCVMCSQCYQVTNHDGHYVFFSVSTGNGCCDCGDVEAWKQPINCRLHSKSFMSSAAHQALEDAAENAEVQGTSDVALGPTTDLPGPDDVHQASHVTRALIEAIVGFVMTTLNTYQPPTPAPSVNFPNFTDRPASAQTPLMAVVLYNDEAHTFQQVIDKLTSREIGMTHAQAQRTADAVDTEGRETVMLSTSADRYRAACRALWQIQLRTSLVTAQQAFNENLATIMLDILRTLCMESPAYRAVVCNSLCALETVGDEQMPVRLDFLLTTNGKLWKSIRQAMRELFFYSLLLDDMRYKQLLGARFVANYQTLVRDFLQDDDESDYSIVYISLQLFTTPTIAAMLVAKHGLLTTVMNALMSFYQEAAIPMDHRRSRAAIDLNHAIWKQERHTNVFHDLRYILSKKSVQRYAAHHLMHLHQYLQLLDLFQGMDMLRRERHAHVEYENTTWTRAFQMTIQISRTIPLMSACFSSKDIRNPQDESIVCEARTVALRLSVAAILRHETGMSMTTDLRSIQMDTFPPVDAHISLDPHRNQFPLIAHHVSTSLVSFHNPLHWMLGSLLLRAMSDQPHTFKIEQILPHNDCGDMVNLMTILHAPLAATVLVAQVTAGLWRRNGYSIRDQCFHYAGVTLRDHTRALDLLLSQAVACMLNPDHFLNIVVNAFEVAQLFSSEPFSMLDHPQAISMADQCLNFIIALVSERWQTSILDIRAIIRRHLVQALVSGSLSHSELSKVVDHDLAESQEFDDVLNEIAEFRFPEGSEHGYYQLRNEIYDDFDPYFFNCRRADRERADEGYRNHRKQYPSPNPFLPKKLVPLGLAMGRLRLLMHNHSYIALITYVLLAYRKSLEDQVAHAQQGPTGDSTYPGKVFYTSHSLVEMALYMAYLAVLDSKETTSDENPITPVHWFTHLATSAQVALVRVQPVPNEENEGEGDGNGNTRTPSSASPTSTTLLSELLRLFGLRGAATFKPQIEWLLVEFMSLGTAETKQCIDKVFGDKNATKSLAQTDEDEATTRKLASRKRQEEIMREFAEKQKNFALSMSADFGDDEDVEDGDFGDSGASGSLSSFLPPTEDVEGIPPLSTEPCIFCQGTTDLQSNKHIGLLCMVQSSSLVAASSSDFFDLDKLKQTYFAHAYEGLDTVWPTPIYDELHKAVVDDTPRPGAAKLGQFISTCGHFMHAECFGEFTAQRQREMAEFPIESLARTTYLCPLCKTSCNILLPIISHELAVRTRCDHMHFDEWLEQGKDLSSELWAEISVNSTGPDGISDHAMPANGGDDMDLVFKHDPCPQTTASHDMVGMDADTPENAVIGTTRSAPMPIRTPPQTMTAITATATTISSATAGSGTTPSRPLAMHQLNAARSMPLFGESPSSSSLALSPSFEERRELGVFSVSGTRRLLSTRSSSPSNSISEDNLAMRTGSPFPFAGTRARTSTAPMAPPLRAAAPTQANQQDRSPQAAHTTTSVRSLSALTTMLQRSASQPSSLPRMFTMFASAANSLVPHALHAPRDTVRGMSPISSSSTVPSARSPLGMEQPAFAADTEPTMLRPSAQSELLLDALAQKIRSAHARYSVYQTMSAPRPPVLAERMDVFHLLNAYVYTLRCTEIATRGQKQHEGRNTLFCEDTNNQTLLLIKSLSEDILGFVMLVVSLQHDFATRFAHELLHKILPRPQGVQIPATEEDVVLLDDPFTLLVQAIYALPSERFDLAHFIHIGYYIEIVRILLAFVQANRYTFQRLEPNKDGASAEDHTLSRLMRMVCQLALPHIVTHTPDVLPGIAKIVRVALLPYLRSTALLCFAHFDVPIRKRLRNMTSVASELDKLLVYLQLPALNSLMEGRDAVMLPMVESWCITFHAVQQRQMSDVDITPQLTHPFPYFVTPLPKSYDVVLQRGTNAACSRCGSTRGEPVLCLYCNEYVCLHSRCLHLDDSGWISHARSHHCGVGLYLMDRQCAIFMTYESLRTFFAAPYLDAHGEADMGLKRGRPLVLNSRRLNELRCMWLGHKLAAFVMRKNDRLQEWNMTGT